MTNEEKLQVIALQQENAGLRHHITVLEKEKVERDMADEAAAAKAEEENQDSGSGD